MGKTIRFGKIKYLLLTLFLVCSILPGVPALAEEHAIERGETALQIAIDHNLTMEQLTQLNPDVDLEMMRVGDILIIPDEGLSFEEFRQQLYDAVLRITDLNCEILADQSALCLFHIENHSELAVFDVRVQTEVRGKNGRIDRAESTIPLMQILPGELLPMAVMIPGHFDEAEEANAEILNLSQPQILQSSFRIDESLYTQTDTILPDGVAADCRIVFSEEALPLYQEKKINVLASAYDEDNHLLGVRSLYCDFYPELQLTIYTNDRRINHVELRMEAY